LRKIERSFKRGTHTADSQHVPDSSLDTDFRQSLVAAVQAELHRHAATIGSEIDRLRKEGVEDRANLRRELQSQLGSLARVVEEIQAQADSHAERMRAAFEARVLESETRQSRRLDDVTAGITSTAQAAARPILAAAAADNELVTKRIDGLETHLRKFDEQAARMVTYVNDVIQRVEARQVEVAEQLQESVSSQVLGLRPMVDEIDSSVRRFQSEISGQVSSRMNDAEDRFNKRLMAAEGRMKEAAGAQIAEIQAHVGRVSGNMDETLAVLNNRYAQLDDRFVEIGRRIDGVEESVQGVDQSALDEMRDKMSAAVGEAMLVRIEMERLQKGLNERTDSLAVRMTEVETQLVDATMDVSAAIQLDRLEELERAVLELDPSRFKAYDPSSGGARFDGDDGDDADAAGRVTVPPPPPPAVERVDTAPAPTSEVSKETLNGSSASAEEAADPASAPFAPPRV
jgi:hypothetical protein